jgi:hypothetical protein
MNSGSLAEVWRSGMPGGLGFSRLSRSEAWSGGVDADPGRDTKPGIVILG